MSGGGVVAFMGRDRAKPRKGRSAGDDRHVVRVHVGRIGETVDQAEQGLLASGAPYYTRGDVLVRMARVDPDAVQDRGIKRPAGLPVFVAATAPGLLEDFERACVFHKMEDATRLGPVIACPKGVPAVYLDRRGRWAAPWVRGLSHVPVLQDDGSLLCEGYAADHGMLVCAGDGWPAIPAAPTLLDAQAALERVRAVIAGFPFVSPADEAVTIAALLSAVARPVLRTCPAFGWSATTAGSGKSMLADLCSVLATGRKASAIAWPVDEQEGEKRLGSVLLSGDAVVCLDNIERGLRGDLLCSMLTQESVSIRVLGSSVMPRIETAAMLLATGNNLEIVGDLTRRFLVSKLDPHMERPELREFDFNPLDRALAERKELVAGLLTILRARRMCGPRHIALPLGSFEGWSYLVRDALLMMGLPDPCDVMEAAHDEDPERVKATDLLRAWRKEYALKPAAVADVIRLATSSHAEHLRDALDSVAGGPGGLSPVRLGKYLRRIKGRVFAQMVMRGDMDPATNAMVWRICTPEVSSAS